MRAKPSSGGKVREEGQTGLERPCRVEGEAGGTCTMGGTTVPMQGQQSVGRGPAQTKSTVGTTQQKGGVGGRGQVGGPCLQGLEGRGQVWPALVGGSEGLGGRLHAVRFLHCSVQATLLICKMEIKRSLSRGCRRLAVILPQTTKVLMCWGL